MVATIGAISIDLTANSAQFAKNMKKATGALNSSRTKMNRSLRTMDKAFGKTSRALKGMVGSVFSLRGAFGGLIAAVGVGALGTMITRSIAAADAIGKVADKVGLTTDELQELRFAADQTGVATNTLDMAMQRFSRRVGEASFGSGELRDTLLRLGINVRDAEGRVRGVTDVLGEYAEAIKNAGSEQEQLSLAFKGFDSEGAALVNLLREGSKGIEEFREQAHALGLVLDEKMVRAAERANDQLSRMRQIITVNLSRLLISLAPTIIRLGESFADAAPKIQKFIEALAFRLGGAEFAGLDQLLVRIDEIDARLAEIRAKDQPMQTAFHGEYERLLKEKAELLPLIEAAGIAEANARAAMAEAGEGAAPTGVTPEIGQAQTVIDSLREKANAIRRTADAQKEYTAIQQAGTDATDFEVQSIKFWLQAIKDGEELLMLKAQRAARAANEEQKRIDSLKMLQAEADAAKERATAEAERAAAESDAAWKVWTDRVEDSLTSIIMKTKSAKDAFRALALAVIEAGIRQAVVAPLVGAIFGGFMAHGGSVTGGRSYLVGEQGPELFTPTGGGVITPNKGLGGGVTYNVDARGAEIGVERRVMAALEQVNRSIEPRAVAEVQRVAQRGGGGARALQGA